MKNNQHLIIKIAPSIILASFLTSCGVPQSEFDKLKDEIEKLTSELDECKFGAEKLIGAIEKAYNDKNYTLAKNNIIALADRHPESPKNKEYKELLLVIEKEELKIKEQKEREEKERIRLANINNTGMWSVRYYVDEFRQPTKEAYIRNTDPILGRFSNTATQHSDLTVTFLISSPSDISIQLYEYAGNNPVKAYSSEHYTVLIQDKDGNRYNLRATNYSDRLSFDKSSSRKVHNILMKGGNVKFRIYETDTPTTEYEFELANSDYYDNANRKWNEVAKK